MYTKQVINSKKVSDYHAIIPTGKVYLKGCRSVKAGKVYDATVTMTVAESERLQFHLSFGK